MKASLKWITDALSAKDITQGMSHYKISGKQIYATNGRIIAAHPWPGDGEYIVPGEEFEKILQRMPEDPKIVVGENGITVRSGRYHGSINTLDKTRWAYPGVEDAAWHPVPSALLPAIKALRPFVSDNAIQAWATCIALENDWLYATNNIALGGVPCPGLGPVMALLPSWAVDFLTARESGLAAWAWTANYVAFKWDNGAWMRSNLVVGQFPERAAALVRSAHNEKPTQVITEEFREAFRSVAGLAEDTIEVHANKLVARFKQADIVADITSEVPPGATCSIWGATFLVPALQAATSWSPGVWPKPAPFKGDVVCGYIVGRKA